MIAPKDIKAGAQFVVTVKEHDIRHGFVVIGREYESVHVPISALSTIPAPSPTDAIDAEIVEAADALIEKRRAAARPTDGSLSALAWAYIEEGNLTRAVDRRRATLKPLDAVEELLDAIYRNPVTQEVSEAAARVRKDRGE